MHARRADHVVDERHPVDHVAERRHRLGEQLPAAAVGLEIPDRLEPGAEAVLKRLHVLAEVARLAVLPHELGLVVEEIDVAGRAGTEQLHHPLDPWRIDAGRVNRASPCRGRRIPLAREHRGQGQRPKATAGTGQKVTASEGCMHGVNPRRKTR
jgi:hypothetical protein